jgi:hypothetical protein
MHNKNDKSAGRATAILLLVTILAGCAQTKSWLEGFRKDDDRVPSAANEDLILGAPSADAYLEDLAAIASGDPARQAEIFADARAAAQLTPNPSTNLRYALVLAAPGHPGSDPQLAQSMLREILTQAPLMTKSEIALASINLRAVEQVMVLESEARRLRESSSRAQRTQEQAVSQRLARVEAENRRLRQELADAEEKLEAITSIEREIREQE